MLRGHESLIRLVGKRHRNLNVQELVASEEFRDSGAEVSATSAASPPSQWVECPVCSRRVRGDDVSVNLHLDSCLQNGKIRNKRTQTQLTLMQFTCSMRAEGVAISTENKEASTIQVRENEQSEQLESLIAIEAAETCNDKVSSGSALRSEETHRLPKATSAYSGCISTRIAGRKYNKATSCHVGLRVALVREPDNPKDDSAIKVLSTDSPDGSPLGHIPRKLASYLSPLLDNNVLHLEGHVTGILDHVDVVSLELNCREIKERVPESPEKESELAVCWEKALHAEENGKGSALTYQQNFLYLLETVLQRDVHLFSTDELEFLEGFHSLSDNAQRLFVRLVQRKGPWFRVQNLEYSEVTNIDTAVQELTDKCFFVSGNVGTETGEILGVLTVHELKQLTIALKLMKKSAVSAARKNELVAAITDALKCQLSLDSSTSKDMLMSTVAKTVGLCVRTSDKALFLLWRLQRLFFLDGEQELHLFLLVDIGKVVYPKYHCVRSAPVFKDRDDLLAYEQALQLAQLVDMSLEADDHQTLTKSLEKSRRELEAIGSDTKLKHPFLSRYSAPWVHTTICTLGVSVLERDRRYTEAVDLLKLLLSMKYCPGRRGYWTVRLSVNLEHLRRVEESLQVAENGLRDSDIRGGDRIALQKRVLRLGKPPRRWKVPTYAGMMRKKHKVTQITGRPLNCTPGVKSRFYGYDGQQCGVEELALQYYAGEDGGCWKGVHSEGGVWLTLFGLLFWDIIFSDVPDVFQNDYQTAPLDLDTDSFYTSRSSLLETRLNLISQGAAADIIAATWRDNHGTLCRGVNWEKYPMEDLETISACVGGPGLSAICKLLAEDHANWSAGMPDLLLWRSEQRDAKLVEVKGPGDRLSEQQLAWFLILSNAGVSVELCKVSKS